jgi:AcrR family transcriptional regulator
MSDNEDTKQKIINAALDIFGEKGFKAATVREICNTAGVNLALINYYFGDKKSLYEAVAENAITLAFNNHPIHKYIKPGMTPEQELEKFILMIMNRLLGSDGLGKNQSAVKFVAREMTNPTTAMDIVFDEHISKAMNYLSTIIKELLEVTVHKTIMRFAASIAGQCMHLMIARDILARGGYTIETQEDLEAHAKHIYQFSINAIRGMKEDVV